MATQQSKPSFWAYWDEMGRCAFGATWDVAKGHPVWVLAVALAELVAGWWASGAPDQIGSGLALLQAVLIFLACMAISASVAFLFHLVRAPYLREVKLRETHHVQEVELRESHQRRVLELEKSLRSARRKLKDLTKWDEAALGLEYDRGSDGPKTYSKRFWVFAKKPIPQPTRLRFWFNREPGSRPLVFLYKAGKNWPVQLGRPSGGSGSTVSVHKKLMKVQFKEMLSSTPNLDSEEHNQLLIFIRADSPIEVVKMAARC